MALKADVPHWDLDQYYLPDSGKLETDLALMRTKCEGFAERRGLLVPGRALGPAEFLDCLRELEDITRLAHFLEGYAALAFAQDTSDQRAQSQLARVEEALTHVENDVMFFTLWWKELPDGEAGPLLEAAPGYRYMLSRSRAFRIHTLGEAEEKICNIKDLNGRQALQRLYDTITNGYRFEGSFLPGGGAGTMGREELMVHARSHLPEVREGAYRELYRVYGQAGPHLGQIFLALAGDWHLEQVSLRRHPSPQAARNKINDLGAETVESLLRVCRRRVPEVFGPYFRLKAKRLGLGTLRRYDVYAPLVPAEGTYSFPEAMAEVEGAFRSFDGQFADLALKVAADRRLDAGLRPGKQGGAFCASSVPGQTPWVLANFTGQRHDLFTLAHELGHAVHSQLAACLNVFEFHSALPLAETASTFGEMLLTRRLMGKAGEREREDLGFALLDDAYATVGRQAFFSLFEVQAHEMISRGATPDELAEAYLANLAEQFAGSVEVGDEFRWEWVSIPHFFHVPFYVYAYSFGQLLVYSLWRLYESQGPAFVPRMKAILAKGGSASPETILSQAGLGPLDDEFWLGGFEVIEGFIPRDQRE